MLLHLINDSNDPLVARFSEDPVRPEIPWNLRVGSSNTACFALLDPQSLEPQAIVCTVFLDFVPTCSAELFCTSSGSKYQIFYTIWSYVSGSGADLLNSVLKWTQSHKSGVQGFYTLSPCSSLARKFHLRNGASVYRENPTSVNYCYSVNN